MHTFNKSLTVVKKLPLDSPNIITLVENSLTAENGIGLLSSNVFLKNMRAIARVNSIRKSPFPEFELDDSETIRTGKLLNSEWNSPRKQLNIYLKVGREPWEMVGAISVVPYLNMPSRSFNLMDIITDSLGFEIGYDVKLGVSSPDVGYGLLTGSDEIIISGSYVQELTYNEESAMNSRLVEYVGNIVAPIDDSNNFRILDSEPRRKYVLLRNVGTETTYISFGSQPLWGRGIKLEVGAHYEYSTQDFAWYGSIEGICEEAKSTVVEGVEAR